MGQTAYFVNYIIAQSSVSHSVAGRVRREVLARGTRERLQSILRDPPEAREMILLRAVAVDSDHDSRGTPLPEDRLALMATPR